MGTEVLTIPEQDILYVVGIIRAGLALNRSTPEHVAIALGDWCKEMENYYYLKKEDNDESPPEP